MKKATGALILCILVCLLCGCTSKASRSVDSLIMAIGEVDASCGPVVEYVRDQYEMLAEEDREKLENYGVLLSAEAAYVDALIDSVGEVTADSGKAIAAAQSAYDGLHPDAQPLVTGLQRLQEARKDCDRLSVLQELYGPWVNEVLGSRNMPIGRGLIHSYGLDETSCNPGDITNTQFELQEDGTLLRSGEPVGTWTLSEALDTVTLTAGEVTSELKLLEEGGYWKLVGAVFDNAAFGYVREKDYVSAFHAKYVAADINRDTIHEYIAEPVQIGSLKTDQDKEHAAFWYASQVYEEGLVYLGASCVIPVAYDHGGRVYSFWLEFPMLSTSGLKIKDIYINLEAPVSGEIFYVKAEYVADNSINAEGFRVLTLTNGVELVFDGYDDTMDTFWGRCDAAYEDHIY